MEYFLGGIIFNTLCGEFLWQSFRAKCLNRCAFFNSENGNKRVVGQSESSIITEAGFFKLSSGVYTKRVECHHLAKPFLKFSEDNFFRPDFEI